MTAHALPAPTRRPAPTSTALAARLRALRAALVAHVARCEAEIEALTRRIERAERRS